ncbi:SAM-dependent methyltransferase [Catenuloplanes atrovinosus]|uniref:O-methyltransferase involved in polyketide biosynthesis n=1 Tax=Catenuloplanes atrovinosus TaxID=137266 RepID=A0AAE3YQJ0_9ACTN|nr:SAM-dependent methyltransferase [Catenuloplanes atrovinosus]MDR7276812.1 O-methyltransferase involved in polyketide biosynthesis [Catenuloplanes atrovinosus]
MTDPATPQTARVWNYWLGGTDNFPADRALGDEIAQAFPLVVEIARATRSVLTRAVRHLVAEAGVRQFLDVGAGLPTADNTHEVAQSVAPECRVVYVDFDAHVQAHARRLLRGHPAGATDFVHADLRDPATILREAARTLDLDRPVAVILSGILAHLPSAAEARAAVRALMAPLPSGSHLVAIDGADTNPELNDVMRIWNQTADPPYEMRSPAEIRSYFDGLELLPPGLVDVTLWHPAGGPVPPLDNLIGVARKP